MITSAARTLDDVAALFASPLFDAAYGEDLAIREHMLQCAALAAAEDADDTLVAAALLHDIGWALGEPHEQTGATWLEPVFGAAVTRPIHLHVMAKRYLVTRSPDYFESLSAESRTTFVRQGGLLDATEHAAFERDPDFMEALRLRNWDDRAKIATLNVPGIETYFPLLERIVETRS